MKNSYLLVLMVLALFLPLSARAQYTGEHYIMHTSGLHMAKSPNSAVLRSSAITNDTKLTITDAGNGYYKIQAADGTYLARNGSNPWNTGFIEDGSGDVALFQIEESGNFIKIKNKASGGYLGVDKAEQGGYVFCDKDGTSTMHMWFLADAIDTEVPHSYFNVMVNPGAPRQQFDGWGISLCWWAHMAGEWDDEIIDQVVDWLVLPENLNYRVFRYNIGGGDDPENNNCEPHHMDKGKGHRAEIPGFKAYEDSEYDWSADEAQIKIMRKIKEKRPDAVFEAFSNSAPWWMTYSGCCSGNSSAGKDNLKPEYYEAFADYLIDVMVHMKEVEGIEFLTLDPFNEPMTSFWGRNGGQEGCHFDVQSMSDFIKVLYPKLQASGLSTVISACDETAVGQQIADIKHFKTDGSLPLIGQINTHTYQGNSVDCCKISALCAAEGIPLWMSEVGAGGSGIQGNLNMANHLIRDMRYIEPTVWCDWQYIEELNDQWCLVRGNLNTGDVRRVNNYFVRHHITHYIKPGYTILTSTNDNTLAATNPEGNELVFVVVNPDAIKSSYTVDLGMYSNIGVPTVALQSRDNKYDQDMPYELKDSYLTFDLEGLTIATFVIPVQSDLQTELVDGGEYYILPRRSATDVISARDGKVCLQPAELAADQIWKASLNGGKVKFTNRDGQIITAGSGYGLIYTEQVTGTQEFELNSVGQQYFKIEAGGKAFDLEQDKSSTGTAVGMWEYGTDPAAATHRQWRFLPIADRSHITPVPGGINAVDAEAGASIASAEGMVQIQAPEAGQVTIATLDGRVMYSAKTAQAMVELPAGIYAVSFASASGRTSQLIRVR
ncbi:MAG: hypothetical protein K2N16_05795 [Muribaculaceae bacterium]|nr:hypothetical protein [Muribaculaceae bacterium]